MLHSAGDRLWRGSVLIIQRTGDRLTAWCRNGRRDDLDGWRRALGPLLRAGLLAGLGWIAVRIVRAHPGVLWLIVPAWCLAAWRAAPPAEVPDEPPISVPAAPDAAAVRALLADLTGDRPGVHLSTLLAHLQERGQGEGWEVADVRVRLEALGLPVRRSVKVAGRVAYGVHRDDLSAASVAPSPGPDSEAAA